MRASEGGILRARAKLGARVKEGSLLGVVASPFGDHESRIECPAEGILIGRNNLPNVNEGDGIFNIARVDDPDAAQEAVDIFQDDWEQSDVTLPLA
mgnify:CR=1 FL=1